MLKRLRRIGFPYDQYFSQQRHDAQPHAIRSHFIQDALTPNLISSATAHRLELGRASKQVTDFAIGDPCFAMSDLSGECDKKGKYRISMRFAESNKSSGFTSTQILIRIANGSLRRRQPVGG